MDEFSLEFGTTKTSGAACWVATYQSKYVLVIVFTDIVAVVASQVTSMD